jgi:hypothetical protein
MGRSAGTPPPPVAPPSQATLWVSAMPKPFALPGSRPIGRRGSGAAPGAAAYKSPLAQSAPDAVDAPHQDERDASEQCG